MKQPKNPFACGVCLETFSTTTSLVEHVQLKHYPESTNKKSTNIQDSPSGVIPKINKICTDQIENKKVVSNEELLVKTFKVEDIPREKTFPCKICKKNFEKPFYLNEHEQTHIQETHVMFTKKTNKNLLLKNTDVE